MYSCKFWQHFLKILIYHVLNQIDRTIKIFKETAFLFTIPLISSIIFCHKAFILLWPYSHQLQSEKFRFEFFNHFKDIHSQSFLISLIKIFFTFLIFFCKNTHTQIRNLKKKNPPYPFYGNFAWKNFPSHTCSPSKDTNEIPLTQWKSPTDPFCPFFYF